MINLKSILGTCLMLCLSLLVLGQTEKGKSLIGADTKFNINVYPESDRVFFELGIQLGGFVANNFAIGAEALISTDKRKENDERLGTETYAIAPFIRYYFGENKIKPFIHTSLGIGTSKSKYNYTYSGIIENKSFLLLYELGGGVAFFFNDKISANFKLGYSEILMKGENADNFSDKISGIGSTIGFVFTF